jgi:hypothetical protein
VKRFLLVSAIIEIPTGLALLVAVSKVTQLLLGAGVSGAGAFVGRFCGVALLSLGVACWLTRDVQGLAARGAAAGMLVYDLGAVAVMGSTVILSQPTGLGLWPVLIVHGAMALWCIAVLSRDRSSSAVG